MLFAAIFILNAASKAKLNDICGLRIKKFILMLSGSSLSVYLIHENIYVKQLLWDFIDINRFAHSSLVIIMIIFIAIGIYTLCTIIDKGTWGVIDKVWIKKISYRKIKA